MELEGRTMRKKYIETITSPSELLGVRREVERLVCEIIFAYLQAIIPGIIMKGRYEGSHDLNLKKKRKK